VSSNPSTSKNNKKKKKTENKNNRFLYLLSIFCQKSLSVTQSQQSQHVRAEKY
jgi:hypothetical protein